MPIDNVGTVQVGSHLAFERRWNRIEKVIWTLFVLFLLLGVTGLFGRGPLSQRSNTLPGRWTIDWERFPRYKTPHRIRIHAVSGGRTDMTITVFHDLMKATPLQRSAPQPKKVFLMNDRDIYVYEMPPGNEEVTVFLAFEPAEVGPFRGRIAVDDAPSLMLSGFVYP
ncbi:MAG TPA: hypothetical protein VNX25_01930 [Verrucomicrobiae bacterium]|nr:hypothetical protein [Verrucomicrobiae bacterium]